MDFNMKHVVGIIIRLEIPQFVCAMGWPLHKGEECLWFCALSDTASHPGRDLWMAPTES